MEKLIKRSNPHQSQIELAEKIARVAHSGQFRRDGFTPYIVHIEDVVNRLRYASWVHQCAGWLHDVIEDTHYTPAMLLEEGVDLLVVNVVVALTNKPGENYHEKMERISHDEVARDVKIADNFANLSDTPTPRQIVKYTKSLSILVSGLSSNYQHPVNVFRKDSSLALPV